MDSILNKAPNWVKCIPWNKKFGRFIGMQKIYFFALYPIVFLDYYGLLYENPYADRLYRLKPKTDEERMEIKRNWYGNLWDRDWEMGQYEVDEAPHYDVWKRREKYPQYYGDKYDTFEKYGKMP